MRILLLSLLVFCITSCEKEKKKLTNIENENRSNTKQTVIESNLEQLLFDEDMVSSYQIENEEKESSKAIVRRLSEYTTKELEKLPNSKRLTLSIVVSNDISKKGLSNTFKSIVAEKTKDDRDLDEIVIFAYNDKNDIGKIPYTFGKLIWAPKGNLGNITPQIASVNTRVDYQIEIDIKDKVGEIKKTDLPTDRELKIYKEIMSDKYTDMSEEKSNAIIMKMFNIKTKEELDAIWLKVAASKM